MCEKSLPHGSMHARKMPSINIFHINGVRWLGADNRSNCSNEPMKTLAYMKEPF